MVITSLFIKAMRKHLVLLLQPELEEHTDTYKLAYKCRKSALDCAVVLHYNILSSLENGEKFVQFVVQIVFLPLT